MNREEARLWVMENPLYSALTLPEVQHMIEFVMAHPEVTLTSSDQTKRRQTKYRLMDAFFDAKRRSTHGDE